MENIVKNKKIITAVIVVACVVLVLAAAIVTVKLLIPNKQYDNAVYQMNVGNYAEAYDSFLTMKGYKDSAEKASSLLKEHPILSKVGDTVVFGAYEQDNDETNGKEPLEWIVLDKADGKMLVISRCVLDCYVYYTELTDIAWDESTLRQWLNGTFLNDAFDEDEQSKIAVTDVSADPNPKHLKVTTGDATNDKVFILSVSEAEKYFPTDESRMCVPTEYANAQGAKTNDSGMCRWWLRSPGVYRRFATCVRDVGSIMYDGRSVKSSDCGVRPAMWIDLGE